MLDADAPRDIQRLADRVLQKFGKLLEPRSPSMPSTSSSSTKILSSTGGGKPRSAPRQQQSAGAAASGPVPGPGPEEDALWLGLGEGHQGTMVLKMVTLLSFVLERLAVRTSVGEQQLGSTSSGASIATAGNGTASSPRAGGESATGSLDEDPAPRPAPLLLPEPSKASYFEVALRYFCMHDVIPSVIST